MPRPGAAYDAEMNHSRGLSVKVLVTFLVTDFGDRFWCHVLVTILNNHVRLLGRIAFRTARSTGRRSAFVCECK